MPNKKINADNFKLRPKKQPQLKIAGYLDVRQVWP